MSFRHSRPPRRKNSYKDRRKSSFLASLGKITIPAALLGIFGALLLNWNVPNTSLLGQIRQIIIQNLPYEISTDSNGIAPERALRQIDIRCRNPKVTDGDTLRCGDTRIRLEGIDTPEMAGHCREGRACTPGDPIAAKSNLQRLVSKGELQCERTDIDHYGRTIARCVVAQVDLSCEQVRAGHAVYRYSRISC